MSSECVHVTQFCLKLHHLITVYSFPDAMQQWNGKIISKYIHECHEAKCEMFRYSHYSLIIADVVISTKLLSSQSYFGETALQIDK